MNLSAGKFFKNLFKRKQSAPVVAPSTVKSYGILDSFNGATRSSSFSTGAMSAHNMEQKGKAQVVKKSRKANKLARKQRKINGRKS